MFDALAMYKADNKDKDFTMMHFFKKLQGCKKWDKVWFYLNNGWGEDGPPPPSNASAGRPIGNKKAKSEIAGEAVAAGRDASIEKMINTFTADNKERDEMSRSMWKAVLEKQEAKLQLEKEKVEAIKMEAQVGMLKAMNEASHFALAKMKEEAKILTAKLEEMDPLARAWHEMYRARISKEVMAAASGTAPAAPAMPAWAWPASESATAPPTPDASATSTASTETTATTATPVEPRTPIPDEASPDGKAVPGGSRVTMVAQELELMSTN